MEDDVEQTQRMIGYWRTRFEFGEIPKLLEGFSTEEHIRILLHRIQLQEKRIKNLEKALPFIIVMAILLSILPILLSSIFKPL